jgi:hypothetical protein
VALRGRTSYVEVSTWINWEVELGLFLRYNESSGRN